MSESPHFSLALEALAHLPLVEYDLLARELNVYSEALRQRGGRTAFSAGELQTLFLRMWDVAKITPNGHLRVQSPVDLDDLKERLTNVSTLPDPA